jgi:hypothetical protein
MQELAERIRAVETVADPWPHAVVDDFLPADVFAELVDALPTLGWDRAGLTGRKRVARQLPAGVTGLLNDESVLAAVRERFSVPAGRVMLEVAWLGKTGLPPHVDRSDKVWNGQVYLAGDPKGTELCDAVGRLAKVVEWAPNRLTCWTPPGGGQMHAAPASDGRYVLLWWLLGEQPCRI